MAKEKVITKLADYTPNPIERLDISDLAWIIARDWSRVGKIDPAAAQYVQAMKSMSKASDSFGQDKYVVNYFLSNCSQWRGEVARVVKAELKKRAGLK